MNKKVLVNQKYKKHQKIKVESCQNVILHFHTFFEVPVQYKLYFENIEQFLKIKVQMHLSESVNKKRNNFN